MTLTVSGAALRYAGNGTADTFAYQGVVFATSDLVVHLEDADGNADEQTLNVDYTITGVGLLSGGSVVFTTPPASGETVSIRVSVPTTQPQSIRNQGSFLPEIHETAFDRLTRQVQKLERQLSLAMRLPDYGPEVDMTVPSLQNRKGKYWARFDETTGAPELFESIGATAISRSIIGQYLYPQTAAEVAAGVTPTHYYYEPGDIRRYGDNTTPGTTDMTAAFQAAVNVAEAGFNEAIIVPESTYKITGVITIHQGVKFVGRGSQGSQWLAGTSILHCSNGDCFKWDGNGAAFFGTGGGLEHFLIVKQDGFSGGVAVNVVATDDNHRPGEMQFNDLTIYGTGTGQWQRGLVIDGTACTTPGTKGVRDVNLTKVRVATCTTPNEYILIKQGVHINGAHVEADTGGGSGACGITISGDSSDICIAALDISGNLVIGDNATDFNLHGKVSGTILQSGNTAAVGTLVLSSSSEINTVAKAVKVVCPTADCFLAWVNASVGNVTGDGTPYTLIFNSEKFDKNGTYDPATGIATVRVAGLYMIDAAVTLGGLGAGHTSAVINIIHKDAGATTINVYESLLSPTALKNAANQASFPIHGIIDCAAGDTIIVQVTVSGSTKTVSVIGTATQMYCFNSMKQLA